MQSYVPSFTLETRTYSDSNNGASTANEFTHISYANECQICLGTSLKPRRLACEHEFCKTCLESYFEGLANKSPQCPVCSVPIGLPVAGPKHKWTQPFKVDKRTLFYIDPKEQQRQQQKQQQEERRKKQQDQLQYKQQQPQPPPPQQQPLQHKQTLQQQQQGHQPNTLRKCMSLDESATTIAYNSELPRSLSLSLKRQSPIRGNRDGYVPGFSSATRGDRLGGTYWGSDVCANGDIVLADWNNSKVKLFNKNGVRISELQTKIPPLDVAVVQYDVIVVSFGSKKDEVYFLVVDDGELMISKIVPLNGNLYSICRCRQNCLGIYEMTDNTIVFVDIQPRTGAMKLHRLGNINKYLSSNSGIVYSAETKRLFCSEGHTIYCMGQDGSLTYEASFPRLHTDNTNTDSVHSLGALSCDKDGHIYVASDFCVLELTTDGALVNVLPTKLDPYTVSVMARSDSLLIAGRDNRVEVLRLEHGVQIKSPV